MKKVIALLLVAFMCLSLVSTLAEGELKKIDRELQFQFVPSKEADVIIQGTKNLPQLLQAALKEQGYEVKGINITVGTDYNATGEGMAAGSVDFGWLPGGTYAIYSDDVDVILTATRNGLSNDSTEAKDWNGEANKTLKNGPQVTYYRSLLYATPSKYGKELAAKINAGEKLTWEELNKANWAVMKNSSSAGYIYPTLWLMSNYDKKITDLDHVTTMGGGYAEAFAQAAAESVDIIVCYADGRNDYEEAWNIPTGQSDKAGKGGMGREDSIWNEVNVIAVTDPIYNDTVAITKANADIYNPEFIEAMQNALISVIETEEGQEIFSVYSHAGYAKATDADYETAREALKIAK